MYKRFQFDVVSAVQSLHSTPLKSATKLTLVPGPATANGLKLHANPRLSPESPKSPSSLIAQFMALDPVALELFEERAAILEYDAGLPRDEAKRRAFAMVIAEFGEE